MDVNVKDPTPFNTFLRLVAGRTSQEVNLSARGADAGITQPTARAWLSVLEASFLCRRLPAWVVTQLLKQRLHRGLTPRLFHWREARGLKVDVVLDDGDVLWLVEAKSGRTIAGDWFGPLRGPSR